MESPIIFLDIDGVITTPASGWQISPVLLERALQIADATDAAFVISSSWREETLEKTLPFLPPVLCRRVVGQTPDLGRKGAEVRAWLANQPTKNWCILDDEAWEYLTEQTWNMVPVETETGLTEENVDRAIEILLGKHQPSYVKQS